MELVGKVEFLESLFGDRGLMGRTPKLWLFLRAGGAVREFRSVVSLGALMLPGFRATASAVVLELAVSGTVKEGYNI